jgi:OmpA-OmpF porin, OOP family
MRNRYLLGAGAALAIALGGVQAHAQFFGPYPPGAFYLGPEGGWTSLFNQNSTVAVRGPAGAIVSRPGTVDFNSGFNAGGRLGYAWGPWRFEEEYSYKFNKVSSVGNLTNTSGNVHSNAIMTNVIYDFTLGWPITPHIGAGIGAVNVSRSLGGTGTFTVTGPNGRSVTSTYTASVSGNKWEFGYQGIAGIRYLINPALALDVDYRYFAAPETTITNKVVAPRTNICCFFPSVKSKYQSNNVVASLTMMFGAPPQAAPPPAPPAPPPPPTHQVYLVFFDWDKYNITQEGMQILDAAAAHYKAGGAVQIQVTGYTDLTGSAGYNQRLSERRANAVATVLERLGVPRNEMVVAGRGMNDPRVPTPLGVREPQNRRVEIVFP